MASDPKQNIKSILDVIDYDGDKEAFAEELLTLVQKQALADLLTTLPVEKQDLISKEASDDENGLSKLDSHFNTDQKAEAIKKASESVMKQYLEEITPTLSDSQLTNLESLFAPQPDNNTVQK
ncbi:hypothetical protein A3A70_03015 [candidate division WWE3 bacterium RIFCSPLOWO2_01_FULL_42_11]|uniref:Uncharacterized protein n=2 Tax=Bacteria candidate phyla TaxID=1783234 RepID=A0A1F4VS14_UNCKA|nr:MAG: hypothetical protein A3A70_03015 [candidate division WWE3 bacterium RIFCSPLOWO2_01_FULL_42_11]OGG15297.1 MAG: hypothetical protein A2773_03110 [Candidatus Gottesmanbacteria bacterium RIFCSPHIGHO2_01_FULL_39_10]